MFRRGPLAVADDGQSGAVNDEGQAGARAGAPKREGEMLTASRERGVIGCREIDAQHPEDRCQEALGLTHRSVEEETERQGGFDGEIGILELPAPPADASRCPRGDRVGREPEGDVASPHEGSVVLGPVPDAIRCRVLRMHSRLHIEIMTRRRSRWSTCRPLLAHRAESAHQRLNDLWLRRVLSGISCRNDAAAAEAIPRAIGLSGSTVSRAFIQASATKLRELQARDLSGEDVVALVLDGKTFAEATMVVALGITMTGDKRFLGVVETDTENEKVLTPFLRSLVERGLDVSQGLLVIVDGGQGLRAAVRKAFRHRALGQRCQWHKRENVVRDVAKREQPVWRQRLQRADNRPEYDEALAALKSLQHELEDRNQSAAGSLAEGLDETLTLHRLGVYGVLGRSLKTTNGLESINALIEERCAKVDHWQHSSQRHRWLATALLDIEPRLRKVMGYRHLPRLRDALKRELKIDTSTSTKKVA